MSTEADGWAGGGIAAVDHPSGRAETGNQAEVEACAGSVGRRADPQTGPDAPTPCGYHYAAQSDCYT